MDWKGGRRSDNIDDQRNSPLSASSGGGAAILFRLLPFLLRTRIGRILLLVGGLGYLGANFLGIDIMQLLGGTRTQPVAQASGGGQDAELVDFVSVILADTEETWKAEFKKMGKTYQEPVLVLFKGRVNSACGLGQAAAGPFYCPGDHKLYIDLAFYQEMKNRLGAPGDFAQAYVIAHEVGHHVQTLLGTSSKVHQAQQNSPANANALSVKLELQADCFAGLWGHYADRERGIVEAGDIEEALNAAAAIGDDRLQQQATGAVRPEKFTHGSSKQRAEWFNRGFTTGALESCNTFQ